MIFQVRTNAILRNVALSERLTEEEKKPVFDVPTIREYYMDLDTVLGVISDGPTKSFAFRRLKYLSSSWAMYSLLNEYQEIADMKVRDTRILDYDYNSLSMVILESTSSVRQLHVRKEEISSFA